MQAFAISLITSLIAALLYGILFSKNEDKIRKWLARTRKGWFRRRYIAAFVGAVRGRARESDTAALNYLLLIFPLTVWFLFLTGESTLSVLNSRLKSSLKERETGTSIAALRSETERLTVRADRALVAARIIQGVALVWTAGFLVILIPFRMFRSRFSYEIDLLLDYLRAIAGPQELVELMVVEQRVDSERTLKEFVAVVTRVATNHDCAECALRFWIWDEKPTEQVARAIP